MDQPEKRGAEVHAAAIIAKSFAAGIALHGLRSAIVVEISLLHGLLSIVVLEIARLISTHGLWPAVKIVSESRTCEGCILHHPGTESRTCYNYKNNESQQDAQCIVQPFIIFPFLSPVKNFEVPLVCKNKGLKRVLY